MDVKQLPDDEQAAYLSIVDGCDVKIEGRKGYVIVQKSEDDRKFEVYNSKTQKTSASMKYPIDAFLLGCKIVGGFEKWAAID